MASLFQPGSRLAGYEILEQVGKGGMGEVYRARQVSMDRIVALKILSPKLVAKDPAFIERFVAEARAAGRLNHSNIIGVHDVGSTTVTLPDGSDLPIQYFSMEFVQGETLKDVTERRGPLPAEEVGPIALAMAEALVYAEAQRVVHRDIKPENIMIAEGGLVKLADLGLAEQVSDDVVDDPDPKERKVMGTPMYMSPEQARGLTVGHASDQYSLGATLFHLLTGRAPYVGKDGKGMMRAHVLEPVPDPYELIPDMPSAWRNLCMRLMAKEAAQRYPSALDMKGAIVAAIAGENGPSRRTRTVRTGPNATLGGHRKPAGSSAMGLVIAAVVVAVAVGGWLVFGRGAVTAKAPLIIPDVVESPDVDQSLLAAQRLVAGLGGDHAAAITALDQALADSTLSVTAREVLSTERVRRDESIHTAQTQAKKEHIGRLNAIAELIKKGQLTEAGDRLGKTQPGPAPERYAEVVAAQQAALTAAGQRVLAAIPAADAAALTVLRGEAGTLPLSNDLREQIEAAARARGEQLDAEVQAAAAKAAEEPRWRELAQVLEKYRFATDYAAARTALKAAVKNFPTAELREEAGHVEQLAEWAQQGENYLRSFCRARSPTLDLRVDGIIRRVAITTLDDSTALVRPASAAAVKWDRTRLPLDWRSLVEQSMTALPADIRRETAHYQLGYCAFWAPDQATAIANSLGEDPMAKLYLSLDKRRPQPRLVVPVVRNDDGVRIFYDFLPNDQRFRADFRGEGFEAGEFGLRWKAPTATAVGDMQEKSVPSIQWHARLKAPCTITARLRLNTNTQVVLVGVDVEGQKSRAFVNIRGSKMYGGTFSTGANDTLNPGTQIPLDLDLSKAVEFTLTVDADNRLTTRIGRDTLERNKELGPGPIGLVMQIYQATLGGSFEIESIEMQGADLQRFKTR